MFRDNSIGEQKINFRKEISALKKQYTDAELNILSAQIISRLEQLSIFEQSKNILIYNNLSDEVRTKDFITKWYREKNFYLPITTANNNLVFRHFQPNSAFFKAALGVMEPKDGRFADLSSIDLIIVPGLAFDRKLNRLGRGKGYYDRFLSDKQLLKIALCFHFQLFDDIPHDSDDILMNMIISDIEIISDC